MNTTLILAGLSTWLTRALCRLRGAARLRRELAELSAMGAHELRDLGISHAAVAAATQRTACGA